MLTSKEINISSSVNVALSHASTQVSITLIATGFKRQEENEGRPVQVSLNSPSLTLPISRNLPECLSFSHNILNCRHKGTSALESIGGHPLSPTVVQWKSLIS